MAAGSWKENILQRFSKNENQSPLGIPSSMLGTTKDFPLRQSFNYQSQGFQKKYLNKIIENKKNNWKQKIIENKR